MITLKAWAKINIGLKILNKRDDGFHNLETTLATINLADFLDIKEIESGIIIESEGLNIKPVANLRDGIKNFTYQLYLNYKQSLIQT